MCASHTFEPVRTGFDTPQLSSRRPGDQLWLRVEPEEPDMDADDLEALFDQYGFEVDRYDGVEGSEDEDA